MKKTNAQLQQEINKLNEQNFKQQARLHDADEQLARQSKLLIEAEKNKKEPEKDFEIKITGNNYELGKGNVDMKDISFHNTLFVLKNAVAGLERKIANI